MQRYQQQQSNQNIAQQKFYNEQKTQFNPRYSYLTRPKINFYNNTKNKIQGDIQDDTLFLQSQITEIAQNEKQDLIQQQLKYKQNNIKPPGTPKIPAPHVLQVKKSNIQKQIQQNNQKNQKILENNTVLPPKNPTQNQVSQQNKILKQQNSFQQKQQQQKVLKRKSSTYTIKEDESQFNIQNCQELSQRHCINRVIKSPQTQLLNFSTSNEKSSNYKDSNNINIMDFDYQTQKNNVETDFDITNINTLQNTIQDINGNNTTKIQNINQNYSQNNNKQQQNNQNLKQKHIRQHSLQMSTKNQQEQQQNDYNLSLQVSPQKIQKKANNQEKQEILYYSVTQSDKKNNLVRQSQQSSPQESVGIFTSIVKGIKSTFGSQSQRQMCKCDIDLENDDQSCSIVFQWLKKLNYEEKDIPYFKQTYNRLLKEPRDKTSEIQIQKDLPRTYPGITFFKKENKGYQIMERILNVFAIYDPSVGYVQGMNFIVAIFSYHAEEFLAFWLLVRIFEIFEMRDIYMPKLPGLKKHTLIIDHLIKNHLPDIYEKFKDQYITPEMYTSPWLFSLFGVVMPIQNFRSFYTKFIDQGWGFFYKIILSLLDCNLNNIMKSDNMGEILMLLTGLNYLQNNQTGQLTDEDQKREYENWEEILKDAEEIVIDYKFISKMLYSFDQDDQQFTIKYQI